MKYSLHLALCAATVQVVALPQQAPAAPDAAPWMQAPRSVGNALSNGYALFQHLSTTLKTAGDDLKKGVPMAEVVDRTIPKLLEEAKLHKRIQLEPENVLRPGAKKARATFGPFKLVGKNEWRPVTDLFSLDPRGQGKVTYMPKGNLCGHEDCTILSARLGLSYEDGSEASPNTGVYIHHVLSFSPSRPAQNAIGMCDVDDPKNDTNFLNRLIGGYLPFSPFTGRGEDGGPVSAVFTTEDGKFDSGYHLGKDDYIVVQSDLVNYKNYTQNVYLTWDYQYVPGIQGDAAISTLLSVTGCLLILPPKINETGPAVTSSRKFPITQDGTILNIRGHMHDGGDKMIFAVNDKPVCESLPEYRGTELWSMSACGTAIPVKKGDWITLTSIYDVPKHPMRSGVMNAHAHATNILGMNDLMGMFGVVFATKPVNASMEVPVAAPLPAPITPVAVEAPIAPAA